MKDNATAKKGLKDKQNDPQNITRSMIEKPHTNLEGGNHILRNGKLPAPHECHMMWKSHRIPG
jgi:hypothetical protein